MARVLAVALAALALAGTALAAGNPPKLHGSLAPPSPRLKAAAVKRIFLQHRKVAAWLRHYPRGRQVDADLRQGDEALDGQGLGRRRRARSRPARSTTRAARSPRPGPGRRWRGRWRAATTAPSAGARSTALPVWLGFCLLFLLGLGDLRRPLSLRNLDLLVLLSFTVSLWFFNRGDIFTSVPLAYPPLLYLLGRMVWSAWRGRLGTGAVPVWPVWLLAAATVFAAGFRIGLNVRASNVIDVGYSGVIGADRIAHGQVPYGHFPVELGKACGPADADGEIRNHVQTNGRCESANPQGDTYGPVAYEAYLPGYLALGWTGKWDDLPAAHFASIAFDLLCLLGLALVGLRFGGHAARGDARVRLGRLPVHAVRLELEHERRAAAALPDLGLLARQLAGRPRRVHARSRAGRSSRRCCSRRSGRRTRSGACGRRSSSLAAFLVASLAAFSILALDGHPLGAAHEFWKRTISWQIDRESPFSIWDWRQYHAGLPDLHLLQRVLEVALLVGAVAVYFVPRRKSPLQLAALTAALLLGFELVLTHWFYLYLPWFFPFAAFAVLAPAAEPLRAPVRAPLERPRQELVGVD